MLYFRTPTASRGKRAEKKNDMSDSWLTEWHLMKWCMLQEKCAVTFPQDTRAEENCYLFLAFLSAPPRICRLKLV